MEGVPAFIAIARNSPGVGVPPPVDRSMLSVIGEASDIALSFGLDLSAQHALVVDAVMRLEPGLKASVVDRLVSVLMDTGERL